MRVGGEQVMTTGHQVGPAPERDSRRAAMKRSQAASTATGSLRERAAATGPDAGLSVPAAISASGRSFGMYPAAFDQPPQQQVALGRRLHDAVGLGHRGHEKHDVDERRVVGDDQDGALAQSLLGRPT